jgi:hypothetical protein
MASTRLANNKSGCPAAENNLAVASPIPELAPVTITSGLVVFAIIFKNPVVKNLHNYPVHKINSQPAELQGSRHTHIRTKYTLILKLHEHNSWSFG